VSPWVLGIVGWGNEGEEGWCDDGVCREKVKGQKCRRKNRRREIASCTIIIILISGNRGRGRNWIETSHVEIVSNTHIPLSLFVYLPFRLPVYTSTKPPPSLCFYPLSWPLWAQGPLPFQEEREPKVLPDLARHPPAPLTLQRRGRQVPSSHRSPCR
jgi:hypothetical protein